MSLANRIRIRDVRLLSNDWYELKKTTFDWLRADGTWQTVSRETYDRGNGATLLPYNLRDRTVVLTRQFRYPAYVNGYDDFLIETAAGLLDEASPEARIRAEVEEETGYRLKGVRKVFECFMSPGSVTERLHFFVGEYDAGMRVAEGGGVGGRRRGNPGAGAALRPNHGDDRARRDRRRQDGHAAAIRGIAAFSLRARRRAAPLVG